MADHVTDPRPPRPEHRPITRKLHGDEVVDPYAWLRDTDDPEVLEHLRAENAYTEAMTASTASLRERLFDEIKGRIQETDVSAPIREEDWWYYSRTVEGLAHPIHCRRADDGTGRAPAGAVVAGPPDPEDPHEHVLLDENVLARDGEEGFVRLGAFEVTPDATQLAWSVDLAGDETYTFHVRNLSTGDDLAEAIPNTYYGAAWAADGRSFFYTTLDDAHRPWQVWHHVVGAAHTDDRLVFEEPDERFFLGVGASRDRRWIVIEAASMVTTEVALIDARRPQEAPRVVEPREQGVEYSVEPHRDRLFVLSNHEGPNFAVYETAAREPGRSNWVRLIAHRDDVRIDALDALEDHLVVAHRADGRTALLVRDIDRHASSPAPDDSGGRLVPIDEAVATISPGANAMFATSVYRYDYESLVTPPSVYEEDLRTGERTLRKRHPVLGGYDPSVYESHRLWATADDGVRVPISLVHRKRLALDGAAPCLLYGYGAYEASMDPWFSAARLSLLERGFVFAIAHVRGGGELGRWWYEAGKLLMKPNTFTDFAACARHLIDEGYTSPEHLVARGGSAGGLLMGAVANLAPDLFRAIVAEVPFVDALNSICDPSLPLTVTEWEEWGNPLDDRAVYQTMKSYSPYENVAARPYPAILATAGLHDSRVGVHEPAKWVARLRETTTGDRPILLKVEMGAGHGGPTDRYDAWRREAFTLTFICNQVGITE